ncbi:MAG: L-2-amino-thiazoline-4-carboxylic acid hydrolase [Deltaproteobacteria bacterium]|nr:L-2-amino-thiazoline-4-carboxylic acid hydrolase [Deltaproteobacteria bacterium]
MTGDEKQLPEVNDIPILIRREIEARMAGPLIKALMAKFGEEETLDVVSKVIESLAAEFGADLARKQGGNSIADLRRGQAIWSAGGANQREILEVTETTYNYNIVRCKYADMYRALGLADLGFVLSCKRDGAMFKGFNPRLKFERTQTIMQGADYCDFRLTLE